MGRGLRSVSSRSLTGLLALLLAAGPALAQTATPRAGGGAIRGEVLQADGRTPLEGARAYAVNVKTGQPYTSQPTGRGGNFSIDGLPAGTYDVAIEIAEQIFVADNLVDLAKGESVSRSYSVQPMRPANRAVAGLAKPAGSAALMEMLTGAPAGAAGFWGTGTGKLLLTILGAGAAVAIVNAVDDDEDASPSGP